jgi:hypothetical protein
MVTHVAQKVLGSLVIETRDETGQVTKRIDLTQWKQAKYKDMVREKQAKTGLRLPQTSGDRGLYHMGSEIGDDYEDFEVTSAFLRK